MKSKKTRSIKNYITLNIFFCFLFIVVLFVGNLIFGKWEIESSQQLKDYNAKMEGLATDIGIIEDLYQTYIVNAVNPGFYAKEISDNADKILNLLASEPELFYSSNGLILYSRIVEQMVFGLRDLIVEQIIYKLDKLETFDKIKLADKGFVVLTQITSNFYSEYLSYVATLTAKANSIAVGFTRLQTIMMVFVIILLFYPLFSMYYMIVTNFQKLDKACEAIEKHNWDAKDLQLSNYSELVHVANTFNHMSKKIKENLEILENNVKVTTLLAEKTIENERQQRIIQETRFNLLQSQINPHFLFNTLNMVYHKIKNGEDLDLTANMLQSTSSLLRKSINLNSNLIKLEEELLLLKDYITIQENRNKNRILFSISEPKVIPEVYIPPFTLQPLVENSIIHGLADTLEGGKVDIQIFSDDDNDVFVMITDNGCGIDKATIKRAEDGILTSNGLGNVIRRLKMLFKNDDIISFSHECNGSSIIIHLTNDFNDQVSEAK